MRSRARGWLRVSGFAQGFSRGGVRVQRLGGAWWRPPPRKGGSLRGHGKWPPHADPPLFGLKFWQLPRLCILRVLC